MLSLVLTTCLLSDPTVCQDRTVPGYRADTSLECLLDAEDRMSLWRQDNPAWHIQRWSCKPARTSTG
ncbi:MAG: hypothetical protein AAGB15_10705 [Pseudomonadota bacterium]